MNNLDNSLTKEEGIDDDLATMINNQPNILNLRIIYVLFLISIVLTIIIIADLLESYNSELTKFYFVVLFIVVPMATIERKRAIDRKIKRSKLKNRI